MDETNVADSSSAQPTPEIPRSPEAYAEWRKTGNLEAPAAERKSKAESTPAAKDNSESASDSEPGETARQERKPKSNAETRLKEILDDLKTAGYTPAELKTLRKEAKAAAAAESKPETAPEPQKAAEKTETSPDLKAPVKPKVEDFESYDAYEAAKDKYYEDLTDYRVELKAREREQRERQAATQREVQAKLAEAKSRYGDDAETHISGAAKTLFGDAKVPSAVKALINDSDVMVDVLFTLGSKEADLQEFVDLAKSNPGKAIRKLVLLEGLVSKELGKASAESAESETPARGEDGKFTSKEPPAKKVTQAPPPPREASGRNGAPADEVEQAAKTGDFASYRAAQNRRDLARSQGR